MKTFRLAIVGAGMITRASHLPAALASPLAEVVAIVDPVVERASGLAKEYGLKPRIASRVEEIVEEIDGAVVATPNDSHREISVTLLRAGVHVLIEKPLASTFEEGLDIVRAGEEAGRIVAVGYSTRFRRSTLLLKQLLAEGYFGAVRRFAHQFGTSGGWSPLSAYNLHRKTAGGGVLVVTGTHFLDRMLYFWGYPDHVSFEDDSRGGPEANCRASFEYTSPEMEGTAQYSKTARLPGGMIIETEGGYVIVRDADDAEIVLRPHSKPNCELVVRRRCGSERFESRSVFQLQLEDFITSCQANRAPMVDGRQGLESLRLIEELYSTRRQLRENWYGQATPGFVQ